ncbi:MAG TPA: VOC family protein [Vicinamibacteria bacterium]|nr:VOC family protein [Vicinamibacteria bacterium]
MTNIVKRTTLMVRDAEAAARWYEHVFGMKRWLDTPFTLSGIGLAAGKAGDRTRLVVMQCEDPVIGMIGLLEWVEPRMEAPEAPPRRVTFGAPIFVVASDDVRGVHARARALGGHIHADPYEWSFVDPAGVKKDMRACSFFDLDGYFYEVNEPVPARHS